MTSGKVKFKCRKGFEVGLIDTGGIFERGGLFSLANTMASVLYKKIECKVETLKYKRLKVMQPKIKTNPSFQVVNNSSWISPHEVLQSTVNTVYHFFFGRIIRMKRGGLKREGELLKEGGGGY